MGVLSRYKNGNLITTLYSDGTRVRETQDDEFVPEFSENVDVHISDRCDNKCSMCYANCTPDGKFGDLEAHWLNTVHAGTEMAVNLNFPMHPDFLKFAKRMRHKGIVLNATVNQKHFEENESFIKFLMDYELIYGLGISLVKPTKDFVNRVKKYPNAVIHVINGIFSKEDYDILKDNNLKVLILGYKDKGRGVSYHSNNEDTVSVKQKWLYQNLEDVLKGFCVASFDNLGLEQLEVKRLIPDEEWETLYSGDDGTFTFFINTVEGYFAKNSVSNVHYPIGDRSIDEMFDVVRTGVVSV